MSLSWRKELLKHSKESALYKKSGSSVICLACRHYCCLKEGETGRCFMRFNHGGRIFAPYGYVSSLAADPIEKKPFFHVLPGSKTLSFGMLGCNFKCDYCQNWEISHVFRDSALSASFHEIGANDLVSMAEKEGIRVLVSTYNEPGLTPEWSREIFACAKSRSSDFKTAFVSNGYLSPESLDFMSGKLDFVKIDLKSFDPEKFSELTGARLQAVKETISLIFSKKIHLEIVTLLVPGFNDSEAEIRAMADFIKNVSPLIPWHLTAFHPAYKTEFKKSASEELISGAVKTAVAAGLKNVYGGNVADRGLSDTVCPGCGKTVVWRNGFRVVRNLIKASSSKGECPYCSAKIYGFF